MVSLISAALQDQQLRIARGEMPDDDHRRREVRVRLVVPRCDGCSGELARCSACSLVMPHRARGTRCAGTMPCFCRKPVSQPG